MENADTTCKSIIIINRKNICVSRVLLCEAQIIIADIHRTGKKIFQELLFGLFYILFVGRLLPFIWAEISSFSSRALHNFSSLSPLFRFSEVKSVFLCVRERLKNCCIVSKLLKISSLEWVLKIKKKNREGT